MSKPFLFFAAILLGLTSAVALAGTQVRINTNLGPITLELADDKAPKTVANFLAYAREGFYDGTIFHRVIDGFMIQGGGFTADFKQKPTHAPVANEADNGLKNQRGAIAMARTSDPQSATAQFFINVNDNPNLDYRSSTPQGWGYAVFGKVTGGMDIVDKIRQTPTGRGGPGGQFSDVPATPVVIESVTILPASSPAPTSAPEPSKP
ncbi:MAG TPA: peptidylprolyl isomerase [Candidatus Competibacteraceae bacterium]|nr:MAG: peptidyl-prolyl cis-trans isomerase [Candidatus Competibacteraceae bacterium]HOB60871.1 peptidylprolyl isomerase [Candidatus Competibacteraceae bacterium]HQA25116.1 peptidylprolyl isomerase [Candidatus Competibacteraceae bacterium]HQD55115.1 peptidylprolyl isomerase [Candidatus Competibacteraceae bacterium]